MNLLSAPLELVGDFEASPPESARTVLSCLREVCLSGIGLPSNDQPAELRVESRSEGWPSIRLGSSTRAHVVVDCTARDWSRMAYQFGHELGHLLCNSWQPRSFPLRPSQWLEETLCEAFALRGLALMADSWEQNPWLADEPGFSRELRQYRAFLIAGYRNASGNSKKWLHAWFAESRIALEAGLGGKPATGPALVMILGELVRDKGCVEDLAALNRWHSRAGVAIEDYLRLWGQSCAELDTPGRLPRRLNEVLFPEESPRPSLRPAEPYSLRPHRGGVRQHIAAIDDLVSLEHPVRTAWALAQVIELPDIATDSPTEPSFAPVQPELLIALWLWATVEGIGSARQLERLCSERLAYRWLCGGVKIDHQMLIDFRRVYGRAFDILLARALASLVEEDVIGLELATPDKKQPQSEERRLASGLGACAVAAAARVRDLKATLDRDDPIEDEIHRRTARSLAVRRQKARADAILKRMDEFTVDSDEEETFDGL